MTNAAMPSEWVRDQSPTSSHHRQDRPKAIHATLARMPAPESRTQLARHGARERRGAPEARPSDSEYVDIDALRKSGRVGALLEHLHALEIVGIGLELALQHFAHGMMMMGVVAHHALDIRERRRLRRVRLERFRRH